MTQPAPLLPIMPILRETARLHWQHVLVLVAVAALYSLPLMGLLTPLLVEMAEFTRKPDPALAGPMLSRLLLASVLALAMSAALFAFWVRVTLLGPRVALFDSPGAWPMRILRVAGRLLLVSLGTMAVMMPAMLLVQPLGYLGAVIGTFAMAFGLSFFFALLSRRLVEASLDLRRDAAPAAPMPLDWTMRFAALLSAVFFGLLLIQGVLSGALLAAGAPLSAMVVNGLYAAVALTAFASICAIVYRLRTVPPAG
jgi:hypothetical protein